MNPLFFHSEGSGFPLLFLHGFCETVDIWKEFVQPLTDEFRIITIDLPGFGKSEILKTPFTIDEVSDAVARSLEEHNVKQCIPIGHSLGGYVTLSLTARHPQRISGFGLFHSTCFADPEERKEGRKKVMAFVKKHGVEPFIDTYVPGLFFDKNHPAIPAVRKIALITPAETLIAYSQAMMDRFDLSDLLRNHEIPKFLITGEQDTIIPAEAFKKMAEIGQNCRYYSLPGIGHMGIFESKFECLKAIRESVRPIIQNKTD